MSTKLTSTGIQFPSGSTQTGLASSTGNAPATRMWYNGSPYSSGPFGAVQNSTWLKVVLNTTAFDGEGTGASPEFSCFFLPKNGYYYVSFDYTIQSTGWLRYCDIGYGVHAQGLSGITVGGPPFGAYFASNTTQFGVHKKVSNRVSDIFYGNAGDWIEGYVFAETNYGQIQIVYSNLIVQFIRD